MELWNSQAYIQVQRQLKPSKQKAWICCWTLPFPPFFFCPPQQCYRRLTSLALWMWIHVHGQSHILLFLTFRGFSTIYVLAGSYWQNFTVVEGWLVKDLLTANSFMVCLDIRIFGLCLSVQEYGSSSETSAVYSMKFSWRCLFSAWHSSWWCNFLLLGSCYVFPFLHGLWN